MLFRIIHDQEKAEHVSASGVIIIISVEGEEGEDMTEACGIEVGAEYHDAAALRADIAQGLGMNIEDVDLEFDPEI